MCGIIGCNGVAAAVPVIIDGLKRLEYRGYDSAGIAVINNGKIKTEKRKGRVAELENALIYRNDLDSEIGIGHTRWATHGEPDDKNAHPHTCGKFTVVHNGIIENHAVLQEKYLKLFDKKSETDTEIIAGLLNRMEGSTALEALAHTVKLLEGSFALAVLHEDEPDKLFCARKSSPLLVGIGDGTYTASDMAAISERIDTLYRMEDYEIAVLTKSSAEFFDFELNPKSKKPEEFEPEEASADTDGYEHFMLKEIHEQPQAAARTIESFGGDKMLLCGFDLPKPKHIYMVACGSAYHAALAGKAVFTKLLKIPVSVETASEFRYAAPVLGSDTPVIIISQSGETADSLAALRLAKSKGSKTVSIVNVKGSSIATESDFVIYTKAGPEIAVATTKAYSAQLICLYALALFLAQKYGTLPPDELERLKAAVHSLPQEISRALGCEEEIKELAAQISGAQSAYFIGRGLGYCAAAEGSLKLKEISYIHCEAYPAGEMKHGTISLIEKGTLVIAADTQAGLTSKLQSNIDEVKSRGAYVIAITSSEDIKADKIIRLPPIELLFQLSTHIVPLQLLGYHIAKLKGCDIDKPRNLAKSVTVE